MDRRDFLLGTLTATGLVLLPEVHSVNSTRVAPEFSPASLFSKGDEGMWFDPSDMATVFRDTEARIPAKLGDSVARVNCKLNPKNYALTEGNPVLMQDEQGRNYLQFG